MPALEDSTYQWHHKIFMTSEKICTTFCPALHCSTGFWFSCEGKDGPVSANLALDWALEEEEEEEKLGRMLPFM